MRALQNIVMGRKDEVLFQASIGLLLIQVIHIFQAINIRQLKVISTLFLLGLKVDIAAGKLVVPADGSETLHALEGDGDSVKPIGDLYRDGVTQGSPCLLEVGELSDLLTIQPNLP